MIQKKNIWFLTLFSLILVLSIYYVTMPSELLMTTALTSEDGAKKEQKEKKEKKEKKVTTSIEESEILTSLRVESNEKMQEEVDKLKDVLADTKSSADEKSDAYEKIKDINANRGKEEELENKILEVYELKSYVKINGDEIRVVALKKEHDKKLANSIMRTIQESYKTKMYISVQFQSP